MKRREGLTLIEVVLAMLLISILLVVYITVFGQNAVLVSLGKRITHETFDYQEVMENKMIDMKKDFIENRLNKDGIITIFDDKYKSTIDIKKIETEINNERKYIAFLSNFAIKEPEPPKLEQLDVGVYKDFAGTIMAFPWIEDDIKLIAKYKTKDNPKIFEERIRWYKSIEDIINPVFASDYDVIFEHTEQEPESVLNSYRLLPNSMEPQNLIAKRFYYFESRAYTFAGRMEHFRNNNRILILSRAGSRYWQDLMEDIYFERNEIRNFVQNNDKVYLDIMQNPDHPTLNLDWERNENPEGALIGTKIPDQYLGGIFQTSVRFQFEPSRLNDTNSLVGIGIGLVNENNSGIMIDLDPIRDEVVVHTIENGNYKDVDSPLKRIDITSHKNFRMFLEGNSGKFDWSDKYNLITQNHKDRIIIQLTNSNLSSEPIEIDLKTGAINPKYIGLKSYSDSSYLPDLKHEVYNKYDRNYSSHFYDIEFDNFSNNENLGIFMFGGGLNIAAEKVVGINKSIYFDSDLNINNVKNNAHILVSNLYVKENLELPGGSHRLGSEEIPGEIHVNGNFSEKGSRIIYGDIFVGGSFTSSGSSSTIYGDIHVGGGMKLWDGSMKIFGNIFINGDFELKDAHIFGNVYVNGNVELGNTPSLSNDTTIYYTGDLKRPVNYPQNILDRMKKVASVALPKAPEIPKLNYPKLKDISFYTSNNYKQRGKLESGVKIYAASYTESNWVENASNIIIVAHSGDVNITNFRNISGIIFAPNGKVILNGGNFTGLIIAKNGIDYTQGGGHLTIKSIEELLPNPVDWPFQ